MANYKYTSLVKIGAKAKSLHGTPKFYSGSGIQWNCGIAWMSNPFDANPFWDDVSSDLMSYSINRGRQYDLDKFESGTATIYLNNTSGNYWPNNTSGIYYPNIDIKKRVVISVNYAGVTYPRYVGYITKFTPIYGLPGLRMPIMAIDCADAISLISRQFLNNAGYSQEASGTRVGHVLDSIGFMTNDRSIDTGDLTIQASGVLTNINAFGHLASVATSEIGLFYIATNGYATFESKGHRKSLTSQGTFATNYPDVTLSLDDILLYNEIRATRTGGSEQVADDTSSQTTYGLQQLVRSGLLHTSDVITNIYALYLLSRYKKTAIRAYNLTVKPYSSPSTLIPLCCSADISTRITLTIPSPSNISKDYFIERIQEDYNASDPTQWSIKWQLSDATQYLYPISQQYIENLSPTAAGDVTTIMSEVPNTGEAHWQDVDDPPASPDDSTTYVLGKGSEYDLYTLADTSIGLGTIDKIRVYIRIFGIPGDTAYSKIKTGGTEYNGANRNPTTTWTTYYDEYTTNPKTGFAWTWSDINALQAGYYLNTSDDQYGRCTQVYVAVYYTITW